METTTKKDGGAIKRTPLSNYCRTGESPTPLRYDNYVPLDYIRAELIDFDTSTLLSNDNLNFTEPINTDTGEVSQEFGKDGQVKKPKRIAKTDNGLIFLYYPHNGRTFISGSLHKFWNDGKHNYNDFDINAFLGVLRRFYELYAILPHQLKINQLEWGVNIVSPISISELLDHLMFHNWCAFENRYDSKTGKYFQVVHSEYLIKAYNKSLQYKLNKDPLHKSIFRFERKQTKYCSYCSTKKIGQTLYDLITSNFIGLSDTLIKDWNTILMYDPMLETSDPEILKLRDPKTWRALSKVAKKTKARNPRKKQVDKLRKLNIEKGANCQGKVCDLIKRKLLELNIQNDTFLPLTYRVKPSTLNTSPTTKQCALTGVDISMQKDDSTFLSHTGLYHLLEHDKDKFTEVKNEYLPTAYHNSSNKVQVRNIAKRIRNRYNDRFKRSVLRLNERENQYDIFTMHPQGIIARHYPLCA